MEESTEFDKIATIIFFGELGIMCLVVLVGLLIEEFGKKNYYIDKDGYYRNK